ncbi:uracil-DNA glycosylase family protein [Thermosyntropha sp.]|uniref:uracil-DNA glycosylase family protein n=1 Tax=Thermosyntropha sp. TaxID=2740820 RepID=UPI0025D96041|nr:uracil-DNA glycosylase family protein [Thermosyntropha sp.]MBO8158530.1 hypothetical protein [Thermosyntropha sp.]
MVKKEEKIWQIIALEDRIVQCKKCKSLISCNRKPAKGKGDLEPDILLVFEMENEFTQDLNKLIELRNLIKETFKINKIYHTFMVRCQPKACPLHNDRIWYGDIKLLDRDYNCVLTGKMCEGTPVSPSNDDILACLLFLLEEIRILQPPIIVLFGEKVSNFVLKAFGVLEDIKIDQKYQTEDFIFFTVNYQDVFSPDECNIIKSLI